MADDMAVSSSGEHHGVSSVSAGGNELGLVEGDAEGESVLGRQSKNVHSRCPICNHWMLSSSVFMVQSVIIFRANKPGIVLTYSPPPLKAQLTSITLILFVHPVCHLGLG